MLQTEWDEWAARHAAAFGMTFGNCAAMFNEWQTAFMTAGYDIEELNDATTWLITHPPETIWQHLRAIQARIFARRKERADHNDKQADRPGVEAHEICGGTGWVFVPNLRNVKDGEWFPPWAMFCVTCSCAKGERIASTHGDEKPKAMRLFDYQGKNPNWQMQMRQRHLAQMAMHRAESATEHAVKLPRHKLSEGIGTPSPTPRRDKRTAAEVVRDEAAKRMEGPWE